VVRELAWRKMNGVADAGASGLDAGQRYGFQLFTPNVKKPPAALREVANAACRSCLSLVQASSPARALNWVGRNNSNGGNDHRNGVDRMHDVE
jgi:hypothetical protein